jgi:hypothetical protein
MRIEMKRTIFIILWVFLLGSCKENEENCETRNEATIVLYNNLAFGMWYDVREDVTVDNDKRFLLPLESHVFNVKSGNIKICCSTQSDDDSFKSFRNLHIAPCEQTTINVAINHICATLYLAGEIKVKNKTGRTILVDIYYYLSVNVLWAGQVTLESGEEYSYFEIPASIQQCWYRYVDTLHWKHTDWTTVLACRNAYYECLPY